MRKKRRKMKEARNGNRNKSMKINWMRKTNMTREIGERSDEERTKQRREKTVNMNRIKNGNTKEKKGDKN